MTWQEIALGLLSIFSATVGWFVREMWDAVHTLRKDLMELQKTLPGTYARRDDMRDMFNQIMSEIRMLREDLHDKADKK